MAGNIEGGRKAAAKNLARNPNFYRDIGKRGGLVKTPGGGFAALTPEEHRIVSARGGRISRKRSKV